MRSSGNKKPRIYLGEPSSLSPTPAEEIRPRAGADAASSSPGWDLDGPRFVLLGAACERQQIWPKHL